MGTIRVRIEGEEETAPTRVARGEVKEISGGGGSRVVPFDTAELAAFLNDLYAQIGELFAGRREVAGFELRQVEIGLEISAEGGFNLIGSAKAGGKGATTLSFAPGKDSEG